MVCVNAHLHVGGAWHTVHWEYVHYKKMNKFRNQNNLEFFHFLNFYLTLLIYLFIVGCMEMVAELSFIGSAAGKGCNWSVVSILAN